MASLTPQRQLERSLFRAWCDWLCRPSRDAREERAGQQAFDATLTLTLALALTLALTLTPTLTPTRKP